MVHLDQCQLVRTVPDNKFVQSRLAYKLFKIGLLVSRKRSSRVRASSRGSPVLRPLADGAFPFDRQPILCGGRRSPAVRGSEFGFFTGRCETASRNSLRLAVAVCLSAYCPAFPIP